VLGKERERDRNPQSRLSHLHLGQTGERSGRLDALERLDGSLGDFGGGGIGVGRDGLVGGGGAAVVLIDAHVLGEEGVPSGDVLAGGELLRAGLSAGVDVVRERRSRD
jgi:hypothetical protein